MTSPARPERAAVPRRGRPTVRRRLANLAFLLGCALASAIVLLPLVLIVLNLLARGMPALKPGFFIHMPRPTGEPGGGMANAIVGTLVVVATGAMFAVPIGVAAGLWLAEYGGGRFAAIVRYTADVLSGVPSIVIGVVAYGLIVVPMGHFSALAGGVALAFLMLPTIVRSTEEVVRLVPRSYREAALALGAPRWRVVQQVVLPAAGAGVTTAILLAIARAAGETAPLLFTALGNRFWSLSLDRPIATLPVMIYDYARAPYDDWNHQAWTGALVLIVLVALMSGVLRFVTGRMRRA